MRKVALLVTVSLCSLVACVTADPSRKPKTNARDGAAMVWVAGGDFVRGSDDGLSNESPQKTISVDGFYIYKTEVTVAQYQRFCAATRRARPKSQGGAKFPVVNVSWHDAAAYCKWAGGRLPTEAEWEKAARGTDGRLYPWGNEWSAGKLRFSTNFGYAGAPTAVGSYKSGASPYGVLDMAGNVYEWCSDWYDPLYYATAPQRNPTGPDKGDRRVFRGGWWFKDIPSSARASIRGQGEPGLAVRYVGFRCVVGPLPAPSKPAVLPAPPPAPPTLSGLTIGAGEIALIGGVSPDAAKWNSETRQFTMSVSSFQLPNGKTNALAAAKDKVVAIATDAKIYKLGDPTPIEIEAALTLPGKFAVIGADAGSGKPIQAREIVVLK